MRVFVAVLIGLVIAGVGIGMLRSLGAPSPKAAAPAPEAPPAGLRVTYWCETCGTEVLLIRRGTESPPRHCGESMVRREEIARFP